MTGMIGKCIVLATTVVLMQSAGAQSSNMQKPTAAKPPKAIVDEVESCSERLGAKSYKVRQVATARLLEIARTSQSKDGKSKQPYKRYVRNRLVRLWRHDDPEVAHRARTVARQIPSRFEVLFKNMPERWDLHHPPPNSLELIEAMYELEPGAAEYFVLP